MTTLIATAIFIMIAGLPGTVASSATRVRADPPICLPTDVKFPVDATGPMPETITIRFRIGDDGEAKDVSIGFPAGAPVSEMLVDAARDAVAYCTWVPDEDGSAGPASRDVVLRLPVVPAPAPTEPRGLTPPKKVEDGCFRDSFNIGPLVPLQKLTIRAKFPVFPDGKPGRARLLENFDDPGIQDRLERSVTVAVRSCEWLPGKDGSGRPTLVWVVLPIRMQ